MGATGKWHLLLRMVLGAALVVLVGFGCGGDSTDDAAATVTEDTSTDQPVEETTASITELTAAVETGRPVMSSSDGDEFTHVYELNGSLDDEKGGPELVATGGTVGPDGFVFQRGDGLTATVDLGETYTIELRVRIDELEHAAKLLDFRDLSSDGGLYIFEGWRVLFWFDDGCDGEVDETQGCPMGYTRQPLGGFPDAVAPGSFVTVRFVRDGDTSSLSAFVDGTTQTWEVVYPPGAAPEDTTDQRVDYVGDFLGEATQTESSQLLHVLLDDRLTSTETGRGELDYLKIAVQ